MNLFSGSRAIGDAIANMVWRNPKGKISAKLRKVCDGLSRNQRLTAVSVLLTAFVLTAFFVFGHACYKIGLGHARNAVEVEHIRSLSLSDKSTPDGSPINPAAYDDAGMEGED